MKDANFETVFVIVFILTAFLDEVFTIQIGSVFFTPLKGFSVFATLVYLSRITGNVRLNAYDSSTRKGFTLLYLYILTAIVFSLVQGGAIGGLLERFFHFLSSLIIIDLLISYIKRNKVNLTAIINTLLLVYYIELIVAFGEVLLQRPLINVGIVNLSPLKIRGFHGDRIFLAEYLSMGLFLYFHKNGINLKLLALGVISFIIVIVSGSNTAIILFAVVGAYIAYSLKNKTLKVVLIIMAFLGASTFSVLRSKFLSDADQVQIEKRNAMYYSGGSNADANWRLFAITEIWDNFLSEPTVFGHGYESSSDFLELKSNYLYKMKPHNIISVLYDYGAIGGLFAGVTLIGLFTTAYNMFRIKRRDTLTALSFIFSVLMISRLLFYYHTTIVWIFIFGVAIITVTERSRSKVNRTL
ncbi:O-antigen ligase-like membrane protein [Sphingobacterium allocomposti]|uniref:O-antigen ligase-like membrane protein n=1 Tax=Sphingobacterium allocomposti TaxID=415956 RepID=A0A5S5DIU4_9SPHI|nr:O-antigen ligase family protein [Sphingobacterium composti Yoo et al. 2007 non Ten et al. 2007]TYP94609.1 O-antigen ligase-like membrane protein [Sphingobacterium composti Yoo et al. 2007 non Ten et al. 2007]